MARLIALLTGTLILAAGALGGMLAHPEALRVEAVREEPARTPPGVVRLRVSVRNRLATFVPMAGGELLALERRVRSGYWRACGEYGAPAPSWLAPFQRLRLEVDLETPGSYRLAAYTGQGRPCPHRSAPLHVRPAEFRDRPFTH